MSGFALFPFPFSTEKCIVHYTHVFINVFDICVRIATPLNNVSGPSQIAGSFARAMQTVFRVFSYIHTHILHLMPYFWLTCLVRNRTLACQRPPRQPPFPLDRRMDGWIEPKNAACRQRPSNRKGARAHTHTQTTRAASIIIDNIYVPRMHERARVRSVRVFSVCGFCSTHTHTTLFYRHHHQHRINIDIERAHATHARTHARTTKR